MKMLGVALCSIAHSRSMAACRASAGLIALLLSSSSAAALAQTARPQELTLQRTRTIGAANGPLAFASIGDVAVSERFVAIADPQECQVVLYELERNRFIRRIGGCGRGPGEIDRMSAIAFHKDSLFVVDRLVVHVFALNGGFGRSIRPQYGFGESPGILGIRIADDSTMILNGVLHPTQTSTFVSTDTRNAFVRVIDSRNGQVRGRGVFDRIDWWGSRLPDYMRDLPACIGWGRSQREVVVLNPWKFEVSAMSDTQASASDRWSYVLAVEGMTSTATGRRLRAGFPSIACSKELIVAKWSNQQAEPRVGTLVVLDSLGRLLGRLNLQSSDSLLMGPAVAVLGREVFFKTNKLTEYPTLTSFRVELLTRR